MAVTDIITLIVSILALIRGASRGFIRSLTGPFSIIVTTALSMFYFQTTQDIVATLIISIISPIVLNLLLNFLLNLWVKSANRQVRPELMSRLGGALLTFCWAWIFIIFTLVLLAVMPAWGDRLANLHKDITRSSSYAIAKPFGTAMFGPAKAGETPTTTTPVESPSLDAKTLAADPRFQKILQDPEVQDEIKAHDMMRLMGNPKMAAFIQQVMSDPATMKKIMTIYSNQTQTQPQKDKTNKIVL